MWQLCELLYTCYLLVTYYYYYYTVSPKRPPFVQAMGNVNFIYTVDVIGKLAAACSSSIDGFLVSMHVCGFTSVGHIHAVLGICGNE